MKPCNESEIVGIKSMGHSKDYYAGYDAAVKNNIIMLGKMRAEIEQMPSELTADGRRIIQRENVFQIIDKYITKSKE